MIFTTLVLDDKKPIYEQIEQCIEQGIYKGDLVKDSKLPSTREVSQLLKISRNTVLTAYDNLESRGIIYSIKGKGSFVNIEVKNQESIVKLEWKDKINHYGKTCEAMDIMKTEYRSEKGMISFKSIAPEENLFDIEALKRAFLEILAVEGGKILNYGYARGYKDLITYLENYMEKKGVCMKHKEILITNGFTEGLDIILSTYTVPGDVILCEEPTHHTSLKMMKAYGINIIGIPMDEQGMIPHLLEKAIRKYKPRWVYLTPSYQNPTGIVMSSERRREIYELLSQYKLPCIEDGFNEELLYSSSHVKPIIALAESSNHITYIGSLSKILFPGIRLGWIIADKSCIQVLESVKRSKNIHTSFLDQALFVQYMKSGSFEKYVKKVKKYYRDKYIFTLQVIHKYLPNKKIWGEGGLYIYVELEDTINSRILLEACYKRGVLFMPGDLFFSRHTITSSMRIGFIRLTRSQIEKGIKIIAEEVEKYK